MRSMTQSRLAAIVFCWPVAALFVISALASRAHAQPAQAATPSSITGVYNGTYDGAQGPIKFKLSLTQHENGTLAGAFTLYLPEGSSTKQYTCDVRGRYIAANRMVQVLRGN